MSSNKKEDGKKCECKCKEDQSLSNIFTILMLIAILTKLSYGTFTKREEYITVSATSNKPYRVEIDAKKNISTQILINCSNTTELNKINIYGITLNGKEVYIDTFPYVTENKDLDFHDMLSKFVKYVIEFVPNESKILNISCTINHNRIEVG